MEDPEQRKTRTPNHHIIITWWGRRGALATAPLEPATPGHVVNPSGRACCTSPYETPPQNLAVWRVTHATSACMVLSGQLGKPVQRDNLRQPCIAHLCVHISGLELALETDLVPARVCIAQRLRYTKLLENKVPPASTKLSRAS